MDIYLIKQEIHNGGPAVRGPAAGNIRFKGDNILKWISDISNWLSDICN